jgi:hypothetical protein
MPIYQTPAGIRDFDGGADPQKLYNDWSTSFMEPQVAPAADYPAWYAPLTPPSNAAPQMAAPPWGGLPHRALVLNNKDVLAAAKAIDSAVPFANIEDGLGDKQPPFLDVHGKPLGTFWYRPQDEYLEWVTLSDPDGVVREIRFTCEGPEYWNAIAADQQLLLKLYSQLSGIATNHLDLTELYFQQDCVQYNIYNQQGPSRYARGDYNPYNKYNRAWAIHLTQGANTLGAEIGLAQQGSKIWGDPAKTIDPDLICCAAYGCPNRSSDPTIGKMVNDLARNGMYVTLRDPIGLYMVPAINGANFTDWNDALVPNIAQFFVPVRASADSSMILRAHFSVPAGIMRNGKQARVGDFKYEGQQIQYGGQVADAISMNLFALALPGALAQGPSACYYHPCFDPRNPDFVIPTPINKPCQAAPAGVSLTEHLRATRLGVKPPQTKAGRGRLAHYA